MKIAKIDEFQGEYRWLSNFHVQDVLFKGVIFKSVEHAYQSMKTLDPVWAENVRNCATPGEAKKMGKKIKKMGKLRNDWEQVNLGIMEELVRYKFKDPGLRSLLLATGEAELVEGNNWGDVFFGVCNGVGENHLGKILMKVRHEIYLEIMSGKDII